MMLPRALRPEKDGRLSTSSRVLRNQIRYRRSRTGYAQTEMRGVLSGRKRPPTCDVLPRRHVAPTPLSVSFNKQ